MVRHIGEGALNEDGLTVRGGVRHGAGVASPSLTVGRKRHTRSATQGSGKGPASPQNAGPGARTAATAAGGGVLLF